MSSQVLWYATRATGLVALVLLTVTMVLGIVTANRFSTRSWPGFAQQDLHKRVSILTLVFLGIHILTSVMDTYVNIGWLAIVVPFASSYDRIWVAVGTIGLDLMLAVSLSSVLRHRIRARTWRALHWLAYLSWPVALSHAFGMGTDMGEGWAVGLAVGCMVAVLAAVCWRLSLEVSRRRVPTSSSSVRSFTRARTADYQVR
jgi:predicted ferric reductase